MTALTISNLSCGYTGNKKHKAVQPILSSLDLSIADGEIVCLLGRSGCGKTTLLKAISGLIQPLDGTISLHGREVSSAQNLTPPENRGIGMIFQDYALFPHLTVSENIAFGLQYLPEKLSTSERKKRIQEMLVLVNLHGLDQRYPHELSGGQQQRVAIARALANKPSLLLLDEPFSNIDSQVRHRLIGEIRDILKEQKVAALFVTHSREEGFAFADTMAVMGQGGIMQKGSAFELYHQPVNRFIADFMGAGSTLPAVIKGEREVSTPLGTVLSTTKIAGKTGDKVEIFVRPQMLEICESLSSSEVRAEVIRQQFMGRVMRTELQVHIDKTLYQLISEHSALVEDGSQIPLRLKEHSLILFDADGVTLKTTS